MGLIGDFPLFLRVGVEVGVFSLFVSFARLIGRGSVKASLFVPGEFDCFSMKVASVSLEEEAMGAVAGGRGAVRVDAGCVFFPNPGVENDCSDGMRRTAVCGCYDNVLIWESDGPFTEGLNFEAYDIVNNLEAKAKLKRLTLPEDDTTGVSFGGVEELPAR